MAGRTPFEDAEVTAAFEAFPQEIGSRLLQLRELILEVAKETSEVGSLRETLKWGQPSYMPVKPKVGTTVRLGMPKNAPGQCAIFVHYQTTLIDDFRELYPNDFNFQGNRALVFDEGQSLPTDQLKHCIAKALTYHLKASPS